MNLLIFIAVPSVLIASVGANRNQTHWILEQNQYSDCSAPNFDPRHRAIFEFDERRKTIAKESEVQCQNSPYCDSREAHVTSATCNNTMLGADAPVWKCSPTQAGSGYAVGSWKVSCPLYSSFTPCIPEGSCAYLYTPVKYGSTAYIYWSIGGIVCLLSIAGLVYFYYRRRSSRTTMTTTVVFDSQPPA